MTPERRDELAELAWSIAEFLPKQEAKETVAKMFSEDEGTAWALIVRGKSLVRQKGERVS
jgi:hypothetical protein